MREECSKTLNFDIFNSSGIVIFSCDAQKMNAERSVNASKRKKNISLVKDNLLYNQVGKRNKKNVEHEK